MEKNSAIWEGNMEKHLSKNPLLMFLMQKFNRDVVATIGRVNPRTILDVGCGEGFTTRAIADAFPHARITAVDGEEYYVKYAKANSERPNVEYSLQNLFTFVIPESPVHDLVVANEVLEHIEDFKGALERLTKMSKRFVLVSVPNEPWFRIANFLRGKYVRTWGNTPGHINHWTRGGLRRLAEQYGEVVCIKTSTFWNMVLIEKHQHNGSQPIEPVTNSYHQAFASRSFLHYIWTGGVITVTQIVLLWVFIDVLELSTVISSIVIVGGLFLLRYFVLFILGVIKQ